MKQISPRAEILGRIFLSGLFSFSLSTICLLNLPYFYELPQPAMIREFLIVLILFGLMVFFSLGWFALPYYRNYLRGNALWFMSTVTVILSVFFAFSLPFLWTIPQIQQVSICYESKNPSGQLQLFNVYDPTDGREFPPQSVGYQRYPITMPANSCITGVAIALPKSNFSDFAHNLGITVDKKNNDDTVRIELNGVRTSVSLGAASGETNTQDIRVSLGSRRGTLILDPWGRKWMSAAKWSSIVLSSIYLALVLFGVTERIILGDDQ